MSGNVRLVWVVVLSVLGVGCSPGYQITADEAVFYQQCQKLFADGHPVEAGECFLDYASRYPRSTHADKALFNAGVAFQRSGDNRRSTKAFARLVGQHGAESQLVPPAMQILAELFLKSGQFDSAVLFMERYLDESNMGDAHQDVLRAAAVLRSAQRDWGRAIAHCEAYADTYPDAVDAPALFFQIGHLQKEAGWLLESIAANEEYLRRFADHGSPSRILAAHHAIGTAHIKLGHPDKALVPAKRVLQVIDDLHRDGAIARSYDGVAVDAMLWAVNTVARHDGEAAGEDLAADLSREGLARYAEAFKGVVALYGKALRLNPPHGGCNVLVAMGAWLDETALFAGELAEGATAPSPELSTQLSDLARAHTEEALEVNATCARLAMEGGFSDSDVSSACDRMAAAGSLPNPLCVMEYVSGPGYLAVDSKGEEVLVDAVLQLQQGGGGARPGTGPPTPSPSRANTILHDARERLLTDLGDREASLRLSIGLFLANENELAHLSASALLDSPKHRAAALNLLGLLHLRKGAPAVAPRFFAKALDADDDFLPAALNLVPNLLRTGHFERALELIDAALDRFPDHAAFILNRAVALRGLGRLADAQALLGATMAAHPQAHLSAYNMCVLLQDYVGDLQEAAAPCARFRDSLKADHPKQREMELRLQRVEGGGRRRAGPSND